MVPDDSAASYYRVVNPLHTIRHQQAHGVVVGRMTTDLDEFDVLLIHGYVDPMIELVMLEFQAHGGKVVYDLDDYLFRVPASWPCYDRWFKRGTGQASTRVEILARILHRADAITCPTTYLAERLKMHLDRSQGDKIHVLPNMILMGDWDIVTPAGHNLDGPVIGWFGTDNHWDDWGEIAGPIVQALEDTGAYLAVVGAPEIVEWFPNHLVSRIRVHPLTRFSQFDTTRRLIKSFDIGLAWCTARLEAARCRSPLKVLQYGAAGVPVIASKTVYGDLPGWSLGSASPRTGVHQFGITTREPEGLKDAIEEIISFPTDASRRADRWQSKVWDEYSLETQMQQWVDLFESL